MPVYEYTCAEGHVTAKVRRIENRHERAYCEHHQCNRIAYMVLSPTPGNVKNPAVPRSKK